MSEIPTRSDASPNTPKRAQGCAGAVAIILLFVFPPAGICLVWFKRLWSVSSRIQLTIVSLGWMLFPFLLSTERKNHAPETGGGSPNANERTTTLQTDALTKFEHYLAVAVELRSEMTDIEDELIDLRREGEPMNPSLFHKKSFSVRDRITRLQKSFSDEFGADVGEYTEKWGRGYDLLFRRTFTSLHCLFANWFDWHRTIVNGGDPRRGLDESADRFWKDYNEAKKLIGKYTAEKPAIRPSNETQAIGIVEGDTVVFSDKQILRILKSESERGGGDARMRAFHELTAKGNIWKTKSDTRVRIIDSDELTNSVLAEPDGETNGLGAARVWLLKRAVRPL